MDLINRQDAIDAVIQHLQLDNEYSCGVREAINSLPSAQKPGEWIENPNNYECSVCGIVRAKGRTGKYNYCPGCGADMRGEGNDNDIISI